jgi:hypothetical protein
MNRQNILVNIDNPRELEKMYQENKAAFKKEFDLLYSELTGNKLAEFWNERLNYESGEISWGSKKDFTLVIVASLAAAFIAKLPVLLNIKPEFFYPRNLGFIVLPLLTAYFTWKNNLKPCRMIFTAIATLLALTFINILPVNEKSDTLILSCVHLPLFLWAIMGASFVGDNLKDHRSRLDFLRYNGDLVVLSALFAIAGGILTGISIGLFSMIGFKIETFYFEYIVVCGAAALPIILTYITRTNPQMVNKVSPVIAKIFSPVVLVTLVVYLTAILYSGKDPYNDRNFLMTFNFLLIGVMAIILFSIAGTFKNKENPWGSSILLALSVVTVIVNGIALSAILFRISEWGMTPNRLAILGANILMLTNLLMVTFRLFNNVRNKSGISEVENSISLFLPVYSLWTIIVTFIFPLIFDFK